MRHGTNNGPSIAENWSSRHLSSKLGLSMTGVQQHIEESLAENEANFHALADNANDGLLIATESGDYVYANARAAQITDYSVAELLKMGYRDLAHPDELERVNRIYSDRLAGKPSPRQYETTLVRKDGRSVPVEITASLTIWHQRRATLVIIRDIVERDQAAREKGRLEEHLHLAQKMEAVGQLASGVAHDFNNLLTVILCSVDRLKETLADNHPALDTIATIEEAAHQATGVTRALLTFSQEAPAEKKPIRLQTALQDSARLLRRTLPASIELVVGDDCHPPLWINADGTQLQQILLNLAINARDAMPHGGSLRISAAPASQSELRAWKDVCDSRTPYVCVTVSDTGAGITPDVQSRIFEPFFTTKPRGRGSGLGLAIVHGLLKEHSGHITVVSEIGKGTTFHVFLPRAGSPAPQETDHAPIKTPHGHGETVLLVGNDPHMRGIVTMALESLGYEVIQAGDGLNIRQCRERHRNKIRAIILDGDVADQSGGKPLSTGSVRSWLDDLRQAGIRAPAVIISDDPAFDQTDSFDTRTKLLLKPFKVPDLGRLIGELRSDTAAQEVQP